jgi:hypothetical protein
MGKAQRMADIPRSAWETSQAERQSLEEEIRKRDLILDAQRKELEEAQAELGKLRKAQLSQKLPVTATPEADREIEKLFSEPAKPIAAKEPELAALLEEAAEEVPLSARAGLDLVTRLVEAAKKVRADAQEPTDELPQPASMDPATAIAHVKALWSVPVIEPGTLPTECPEIGAALTPSPPLALCGFHDAPVAKLRAESKRRLSDHERDAIAWGEYRPTEAKTPEPTKHEESCEVHRWAELCGSISIFSDQAPCLKSSGHELATDPHVHPPWQTVIGTMRDQEREIHKRDVMLDELRQENERLRGALAECIDEFVYASGYKGEHLKDKHGDNELIAKFRAALAPTEATEATPALAKIADAEPKQTIVATEAKQTDHIRDAIALGEYRPAEAKPPEPTKVPSRVEALANLGDQPFRVVHARPAEAQPPKHEHGAECWPFGCGADLEAGEKTDALGVTEREISTLLRNEIASLASERDAIKAENERLAKEHRFCDAKLSDAKEETANANANTEMYARAWQRELGPPWIAKNHRIDGLVLTTRDRQERLRTIEAERDGLRKELEEAKAGIARLEGELDEAETEAGDAVAKAVEAETERCAKVAGDLQAKCPRGSVYWSDPAAWIAAGIHVRPSSAMTEAP